MALTITELTSPSTSDQIFQSMIIWLVAQGLPADKWRNGGVSRTILMAVAVAFAILSILIADFAAGAYLDTATGDWLTALAQYVYNVVRPAASYATGTALVSNASGNVYTYNPGQLIVITNDDAENPGVSYTNVDDVTLNPGAGNQEVDVQATILGSGGNAAPGDVTVMGVGDTGVSVSNTTAIVGQDAMSDATLRALCLAKLGALSMAGPRGAYQYAIQSALNGTAPVNVNRWSISGASSTGIVTVYVASPSGPVTDADVAAVVANIEAIARPDSVTVNVSSASVANFSSVLTVWALATKGLDATTLSNLVDEVLIAFIAQYFIGGLPKPPATQGYLYAEQLEAEATTAHPAIFAIDSTAGDLALDANQVAALSTTINVRFVTAPTSS